MINESIFRSYDVRGIYPTEINEEAAEAVGGAVVKYLKAKQVVVGRDMRLSSPSLYRSLVKGITNAGADVIDIGMVPTPVVYFTVAKFGYDAGIMISASHNPPEYNGLKIVRKKALQLSKDDGIEDIKKMVCHSERGSARCEESTCLAGRRGSFTTGLPSIQDDKQKPGKVIKKDIKKEYFKHILSQSDYCSRAITRELKTVDSSRSSTISNDKIKRLKIIIDAGNGMGGFFKPVLDKLPIKYKAMYFKPDGTYPNHAANPAEAKNLHDVIRAVKKEKADFGVAFDGDADRAIFIDDKGEVVRPDYFIALLAEDELKKSKDKRVYYDLRFSHIIIDKLKELGAKPVKTRVGNPFYKQGLINQGGTMAAELSGHIMFASGFGLDDGLLPVVKLVNFLSRQEKSLSHITGPLKGYYANPGEINVESHNSAKVIEGMEKKYGKLGKVDKLDGLTIEMKDWWFNVRGSNTEPVIRINLETKPDEKFMMQRKKELLEEIKKLDR